VITWVCGKINTEQFFSSSTLPLSQQVLLSLIQQLGFDLSKDTNLKLTWLRGCALVLNLKDRIISEHAPVILAKVLHNLEEHYPRHSDPTISTSFKLLMHVINSLLK
jgi:enhancer of mRNA-decapping protein 4